MIPPYLQEWRDSGVSDQVIAANVEPLEGDVVYESLCSHLERRNDGRLTDPVLRRYAHCTDGGWWCSGLEFWQDDQGKWHLRRSQWGAFKPDNPRINLGTGKTIKYEHPPKVPTSVFMLDIPSNPRFWLEVLANVSMPLVICEGAKKAACLLSLGIPAIALPGIFNGYRQPKDSDGNKIGEPHLIPELQVFCQPGRPIFFCFDHDTKPQTVFNVRLAIARTGKLFQKAGCQVKVISLPGPEKGVDDFIVSRGAKAWQELYEAAVDLREWSISGYLLTYAPDIELNQRFIGSIDVPDDLRLVLIRAPKGAGKTEWLAARVERAYREGRRALVLTYREQLGLQLSQRFNLHYKTQVNDNRLEVGLAGMILCVDSLHPGSEIRFNWEDWQDCEIIIDECESVTWHLLNSSTCTENRVSILNQFQNLIRSNLSPGSRGSVTLSDADLSDYSVNFIKGLAEQPDLRPFTIVNHWQSQGGKVYSYDTPASLYSMMMENLPDGKHLILTTGQRADSKWGSQTLEKAIRDCSSGIRILRIDKHTIADPSHPAYGCLMGDINALLAGYDVVIASPTIESGVSIDLYDHFAGVWGFFPGVTPENSVRQFLARLRDNNVPRHIFVAERGMNTAFVGSRETSPKALLESQNRIAQVNLNQLRQWAIAVDEDGTVNHCPAGLETYGRLGARINQGLHSYRAAVLAGLKAEGHQVISGQSLDKDTDKEISDQVGAIRDENHEQYCHAVAAAIPPATERDYEELKQKKSKTAAERHSQRHYELNQRYLSPPTAARVAQDDDGWYAQILRHYYLTADPEFQKLREEKRFKEISPDGIGWIPDVNRKSLIAQIQALKALKVDQILTLAIAGEEFSSSHPLAIESLDRAKECSADVRRALGLTVLEKITPIGFIQNVFDQLLGFRLSERQRRIPGTVDGRERVYYFSPLYDGREEVFAAWQERDRAAVAVASSQPEPEPTAGYEPEPPARSEARVSPENHISTSGDYPIAVTRNAINISKADHVTNFPRVTDSPPNDRGSPQRLNFTPGMVVKWGKRAGEWVVQHCGTAIAILTSPGGKLEWSADLADLEVTA